MTLQLPAYSFNATGKTGMLTTNLLALWLLGHTNRAKDPEEFLKVDEIFKYLNDAHGAALPRPKHHGHYFKNPIRVGIQHFRLGFGVGSYVYAWVIVWLTLLLVTKARLWRWQ